MPHFFKLMLGAWVGTQFIAPMAAQFAPNIWQDQGILGTMAGAAAIAGGVVIVSKVL